MLYVFTTAPSSRPETDAIVLADALGITPYELRLALAPGPPSIVCMTEDAGRAQSITALARNQGYAVQSADGEDVIATPDMVAFSRFAFEQEGVRRVKDGELLGFGDVFCVLRAVHEIRTEPRIEAHKRAHTPHPLSAPPKPLATQERENVAYFFRRSGARPWILRERHSNYASLGRDLAPTAFGNFTTTVARFAQSAPMSVVDDRLLRRRVPQRLLAQETIERGAQYTTRQMIDLLAHLLAVTIASQGGSPYR